MMSELVLTQQRERVQSCETLADGVVLRLADRSLMLEISPDGRGAARACRLATRVLNVELSGLGQPEPQARVTAVWHRMPHARSISVAAALALVIAGVPSFVVCEVEP